MLMTKPRSSPATPVREQVARFHHDDGVTRIVDPFGDLDLRDTGETRSAAGAPGRG